MSISKPQSNESIPSQVNRLARVALIFSLSAIGIVLCGVVVTIIIPYALYFSETVCVGFAAVASAIGLSLGIMALLQINNEPAQKGRVMAIISIVIGLPILLLGIWIAYLFIIGPVITFPTTP